MPSGNFNASIVTPPLTVGQFYTSQPNTPGNVGLCLSGGGSRALTAGMGQLQGLNQLGLLGQVRALSTVSGGSWLGVPYELLPAGGPTDTAYYGPYVANPASLTLPQISSAPFGAAGNPLCRGWFSPEMLALEAFVLWYEFDVPANMLWQTVVALNILSPLGLFSMDSNVAPIDTFSYNGTTQQQIVSNNSSLASETFYLSADQVSQSRSQRPFMICNMAMLMKQSDGDLQLLAPVQSTGFFTGILGSPKGTDANGLPPGGGGVTSFAFNSNFVSGQGDSVVVDQSRQWAVTDAVGTSSAFFAEMVANLFADWENDIGNFFATLWKYLEDILKWIEHHLPFEQQAAAKSSVMALATRGKAADLAALSMEFPVFSEMIPLYGYWPATETTPTNNPQPSQFADGGSLDNTGICGVLAYKDIENVISFVNSEVVMSAVAYGVSDGNGGFIPGTYIQVDECIPPLFGYQPYNANGAGYVLYTGGPSDTYKQYAHNQVFPSGAFPDLLKGLWANSGAQPNQQPLSPAIFSQPNLTVQRNDWFGIKGGQTITAVWGYLNYAQDFANVFAANAPVYGAIQSELANNSFPNYSTLTTDLDATQINLLSLLTAWSVVTTDQRSQVFSSLFKQARVAAGSGA